MVDVGAVEKLDGDADVVAVVGEEAEQVDSLFLPDRVQVGLATAVRWCSFGASWNGWVGVHARHAYGRRDVIVLIR